MCVVASLAGVLASWSERAWDQMSLPHTPQSGVMVVTIDDTSLAQIGRWPWDRSVHAALIERITLGRPAAIGYDVTFAEPQDAVNDTALAEAIRVAGNVVLPIETTVAEGSVRPLPALIAAAQRLGHVTLRPDSDGVVRRVALSVEDDQGDTQRAFAYEVLRAGDVAPPASALLAAAGAEPLRIAYPGGMGTVAFVPAVDVLSGAVPASSFTDAVVFIGATAPSLHDTLLTPFGVLSGVETHASIADTLLARRFLTPIRVEFLAALIFTLALISAVAAAWLRMRWAYDVFVACGFSWGGEFVV